MSKKKDTPSLEEFVREQRVKDMTENCPVCQLPDEIRAQIEGKEARRAHQLAWLAQLREEGHIEGPKITDRDLNKHYSGRHPRVEE